MSLDREKSEDNLAKVLEALNLHKMTGQLVSSAELKLSLAELGDKVIVGKYDVTAAPMSDDSTKAAVVAAEDEVRHDIFAMCISACLQWLQRELPVIFFRRQQQQWYPVKLKRKKQRQPTSMIRQFST